MQSSTSCKSQVLYDFLTLSYFYVMMLLVDLSWSPPILVDGCFRAMICLLFAKDRPLPFYFYTKGDAIMANVKNVYLVDYENVGEAGLFGAEKLTDKDIICIFTSLPTASLTFKTLSLLNRVDLRCFVVPQCKQSADMCSFQTAPLSAPEKRSFWR